MSQKKLRVLIISSTPWRNDNSFGNTYNSFFKDGDFEIANIYCKSGLPDSSAPVKTAFQITERSLINNLIKKEKNTGYTVEDIDDAPSTSSNLFNVSRRLRWQILFWGRDLIWKFGKWHTAGLEEFIDSFDPDILFLPVYYSNYMCDIDLWAMQYCNIPVFTNISDDIYTLKQFNLSPLFWIDRFIKRKKIKKIVDSCNVLYVCSPLQLEEYKQSFNTEIKILRKGFDFNNLEIPSFHKNNSVFKLLYAGNIGSGRWQSLGDIALVVSKLNQKDIVLTFDVYTPTPITSAIKKVLTDKKVVNLHKPVSFKEVEKLQEQADILIHVESFNKKDKLCVRQSLSTKIPDYLSKGGCILAYGPSDVASIDYLYKSNSSLVASSLEQLETILNKIVTQSIDKEEFRRNAYKFAKENHNKKDIQKMLSDDFRKAIDDASKRLMSQM